MGISVESSMIWTNASSGLMRRLETRFDALLLPMGITVRRWTLTPISVMMMNIIGMIPWRPLTQLWSWKPWTMNQLPRHFPMKTLRRVYTGLMLRRVSKNLILTMNGINMWINKWINIFLCRMFIVSLFTVHFYNDYCGDSVVWYRK